MSFYNKVIGPEGVFWYIHRSGSIRVFRSFHKSDRSVISANVVDIAFL